MEKSEKIVVEGRDGEELAVFVDRPSEPAPSGGYPAIIIAHGFKGFATWGFFPWLAARIAEAGIVAIRLNFSHNGGEGHGEDFPRLDRFEKNTFSREIDELGALFDAVVEGRHSAFSSVDPARIGTLGHSRGGGIALLHAADEPRLAGVATWSAVASFDRFTDRQREIWRDQGFLEVQNARTGQTMRLGAELLQDLESQGNNLDICSAVRSLRQPLLVVHGEVDLTVTIENAVRIDASVSHNRSRLVRIPRTGHTFGVVHPFAGTTEALEVAIDETLSFFREVFLDAAPTNAQS